MARPAPKQLPARYRPGQAPAYALEGVAHPSSSVPSATSQLPPFPGSSRSAPRRAVAEVIVDHDDDGGGDDGPAWRPATASAAAAPRRTPAATTTILVGDALQALEEAQEEADLRAREVAALSELVEVPVSNETLEAAASEQQARRLRARQAAEAGGGGGEVVEADEELLARLLAAEDEGDSDADGSGADDEEIAYEYVTDSEGDGDDDGGPSLPPPPMYVARRDRTTVPDPTVVATTNAAEDEKLAREAEERAAETRQLIDGILKQEREEAELAAKEADMAVESDLDTTDEEVLDEEAEFEKWRLRELRRIKRTHEERSEEARAKAEVEQRRKLSDADIRRLDADRLKRPEKAKLQFLQKYWHKGAFYQDDELMKRDYSAPTGDDAIANKALLPEVMQVRGQWGRMGRTKWTHLAKEDTTAKDPDDPLRVARKRPAPSHTH